MSWQRERVRKVDVTFELSGIYGKERHRSSLTKYGKIHTYNTASESAHADEIAWLYRKHAGADLAYWMDEVTLEIDVMRPCAKGTPIYKQGQPDLQKPDGDNIAKLVKDALTGIAWVDDKQVTQTTVRKHPRRIGKPTMRIRISYYKNKLIKE